MEDKEKTPISSQDKKDVSEEERRHQEEESKYHYNKFKDLVNINFDEVTMILHADLLTEYYFDQLIIKGISRGDIIINKKFTFWQKYIIVKSLDIVPEFLLDSVINLHDIRNNCSHVIDYKISEGDIDNIGRPFRKEYLELKSKYLDNKKEILHGILMFIIARLTGITVRYIKK